MGWGSRTFGLVLVDLDSPGEQLPGERRGAGEHPGLPGHLVLLHRDLDRVHGWHERHGSTAATAHTPPAGLQPSQGGEPAAQPSSGMPSVRPPRLSLPPAPGPWWQVCTPVRHTRPPPERLRPALPTVKATAGAGGGRPAWPGPCVLCPSHLLTPVCGTRPHLLLQDEWLTPSKQGTVVTR